MSQGGLRPQQIHAIPIGTPPPTVSMCSGIARCHAQERTDVPALIDSPALLPSQIPGLHPADLATAYRLPADAPAGRTVAIVVAYSDPNAQNDLAVYRKKFDLPPCTVADGCLAFYNEHGTHTRESANADWATETAIDLDMVSAACHTCKIDLIEASSDAPADLIAALKVAAALHPAAISNSWSIPEYSAMQYLSTGIFAHAGVAVVAGSGDSGAGVSWPAAERSVIAVGGTTLVRDANSVRGWIEAGWRNAGFGCSAYVTRPAWQALGACGTHRGIADIAAVADPATGVAIYTTYGPDKGHHGGAGGWEVYGGTSVATAVVAGAIAGAPVANDLSDASYIYAHADQLNPVAATISPLQSGLGTPNGSGAL